METNGNGSAFSGGLSADVEGFARTYRDSELVIKTASEIDTDDVRRIVTPALSVAIARILQADGWEDGAKIGFIVAVVLAGQKHACAEEMASADKTAMDWLRSSVENSEEK